MKKVILVIDGMSCSACSNAIEKYLLKQKGVIDASVNLVMAQASITYDDSLTIDDLNRFIEEAGYKSLGVYDEIKEKKSKNNKTSLIIYGILSVIVLYGSMSHMVGLPSIPYLHMMDYPINYSVCLLLFSILFLVYARDIFKKGLNSFIHKAPNMDTLVSVGVISSFLYSLFGTIMIILGDVTYVESLYFESACIVIFFIKLGRYIDNSSKEKTKDAINELVTITPSSALIRRGNKETEVTIDEVKKGDILICKPGMKVAVDGKIVSGVSHFDEAFITGESIPSKKKVGDTVVAGSLNIDGVIEYEAINIGRNSTISEIVRLVVDASNTKAPISRIADKICGVFVPSIMVIAFLVLIVYLLLGSGINESLTHFVSVLVVACPCALGLATPLAMVTSLGFSARSGILVKTSAILEKASDIDTIVFDKTGTLTYGNLKVSKVYNYSKMSDRELIRIVSSLESNSTHPIASAFSKNNLIKVKDFKNMAGIGLTASIDKDKYYVGNSKLFNKLKIKNKYLSDEEKLTKLGNSILYVIKNKETVALIGVKDVVRDSSKNVVSKLKKQGLDVIMLTGDNDKTASVIAREIGITNVISNVMPKDKVNIIKELMASGKKVMMCGDGINDAPALASSDIGLTISSGTDIASNSSDVILMNDNLENIINLIKIGKKTITNIKENLFWAFFYNICMIPIAIGLFEKWGISLNPMLASLSMTLSSLCVVLNALRLRKIKLGGE